MVFLRILRYDAKLAACPHHLQHVLKILSSKCVCCVFRNIRDKNAVNQVFLTKTTVLAFLQQKCSPQSSVFETKKIEENNPHQSLAIWPQL